jgi:tRNA(adenine34) deaminase
MPAQKKKRSSPHRWSASVTTDSTHPPKDLFNKSAAVIARTLASKKVSPKGPGSGMRMLTFYINRAGHNLSSTRQAELQKAKTLLSNRIAAEKEKKENSGGKHRKTSKAR